MKTKSFLAMALCGMLALAPATDTFATDKHHQSKGHPAAHGKARGDSRSGHSSRLVARHGGGSRGGGGPSRQYSSRGSINKRPQVQFARSGPSRIGPHFTPRRDTHRWMPPIVASRHRAHEVRRHVPYFRPLPYFSPWVSPYSYGVSVVDVQRALAERGFYYGPIDGFMGPMTRQAIADFQAEAELPVTGTITSSLVSALDL